MSYFRSKKVDDAYLSEQKLPDWNVGCKLCEAATVFESTYWRIIPNKFPYDLIAHHHAMIVPRRHVREDALTHEELDELKVLKSTYINDNFMFIVEATPNRKSIPAHFHLHLIEPRLDLETLIDTNR